MSSTADIRPFTLGYVERFGARVSYVNLMTRQLQKHAHRFGAIAIVVRHQNPP